MSCHPKASAERAEAGGSGAQQRAPASEMPWLVRRDPTVVSGLERLTDVHKRCKLERFGSCSVFEAEVLDFCLSLNKRVI